MSIVLRHPTLDEVPAVLALFAEEVEAGRMLPREAEQVQATLSDWIVAVESGTIVGCVSLVTFNPTLCEVRSLAVAPESRGQGLGTLLIESIVTLATERGIDRVLTLTRAAALFESVGFRRAPVTDFPSKVLKDCAPCPLKHICDEIALVLHLDGHTEPQPPAIPFYTAAGGSHEGL